MRACDAAEDETAHPTRGALSVGSGMTSRCRWLRRACIVVVLCAVGTSQAEKPRGFRTRVTAAMMAAVSALGGAAPAVSHAAEFQRLGSSSSKFVEFIPPPGSAPAFTIAEDGRAILPAGFKRVLDYLNANKTLPSEFRLFVNANPHLNNPELTAKAGQAGVRPAADRLGGTLTNDELRALSWINSVPHVEGKEAVVPGARIILPRTPSDGRTKPYIVVDKSSWNLYVVNGARVDGFVVGLGGPKTPTALGTYWLGARRDNPAWNLVPNGTLHRVLAEEGRLPERTSIPGGDPDNPLGLIAWNLLDSRWTDTFMRMHGTKVSVAASVPWKIPELATKEAGIGPYSDAKGLTGSCIRVWDLDGLAAALDIIMDGHQSGRGKKVQPKIPVHVVLDPVKMAWFQGDLFLQVDVVPAGHEPVNRAGEIARIRKEAESGGLDWDAIAGRVEALFESPTGVPTRVSR